MTDAALDRKFVGQASRSIGEVAARTHLARCRGLLDLEDARDVWRPL